MRLYAITNRRLFAGTPDEAWQTCVEQGFGWVLGGVEFIQIREKDWQLSELRERSLGYIDRVSTYAHLHHVPKPCLLMNTSDPGQVEMAGTIRMDGVHLGSAEQRAEAAEAGWLTERVREARQIWHSRWPERAAPVISVSCHTAAAIEEAGRERVSVILFAPVFAKPVWERAKREGAGGEGGVPGGRGEGRSPAASIERLLPGIGLEAFRAGCAVAGGVPVFALGGITVANAGECVAAGAAGVAGIRLFLGDAWLKL